MLRLPANTPQLNRYALIKFLLKQLELQRCEQTLIKQLSGGEAKRLCLASCLLTDPSIILFDDCNTGLDSHLALSLVRHIRSLKKTTILVLHQPSTRMMSLIDDICLFGLHGRMIYMGPFDQVLTVFHTPCSSDINPTDFLVEQAALSPSDPKNSVATDRCAEILDKQFDLISGEGSTEAIPTEVDTSYSAGFFTQVRWLLWRSMSIRETGRLAFLLSQSLILAIIYGILDVNIGRKTMDQSTVQNISGLFFRVMVMITRATCLLVLATSPIDHDLLQKESYQQRLYSVGAYYLSKCISESPFLIIIAWLFTTIVVFFTGVEHYFLVCLIMIFTTICGTALGSMVSSIVRTKETRLIYWYPISQVFSIFSGYYVNSASIPFPLKWLEYLSYCYYGFSLSLISQWSDVDHIACHTRTWNMSVSRCYRNGQDVLRSYDIRMHGNHFYLIGLIVITAVFHLISYGVLLIQVRRRKGN